MKNLSFIFLALIAASTTYADLPQYTSDKSFSDHYNALKAHYQKASTPHAERIAFLKDLRKDMQVLDQARTATEEVKLQKPELCKVCAHDADYYEALSAEEISNRHDCLKCILELFQLWYEIDVNEFVD